MQPHTPRTMFQKTRLLMKSGLAMSSAGLEPVSIAVAVSRGKRPDVAFIPEAGCGGRRWSE